MRHTEASKLFKSTAEALSAGTGASCGPLDLGDDQ